MTGDRLIPFNPLDKRHLGSSVAQALPEATCGTHDLIGEI